ncbi:MAG: divalent-cation tolerance protein CutA [Chloroflexota bacterium]|nr:divalent-cation tolerance protein CutA [Chloroflexota bacterium]
MDAQLQQADSLVLLYVPCGSEEYAAGLASRLLEERLIACANIYASRSLYNWNGKLSEEQEQVVVCKTLASRAKEAVARVKQIHSYETPCIITLVPARANDEFYTWVRAEVTGPISPAG